MIYRSSIFVFVCSCEPLYKLPERLAYVQLVDAHEPLAEEEGEELLVHDGLELRDEELPGGLVQQLVVVRLQLLLQVLGQPAGDWDRI